MYAFGYDPRPRPNSAAPRLSLTNEEVDVIDRFLSSTRKRVYYTLRTLHSALSIIYSRLVAVAEKKGKWYLFQGRYTDEQITLLETLHATRAAAQATSDEAHAAKLAEQEHGQADEQNDGVKDDEQDDRKKANQHDDEDVPVEDVAGGIIDDSAGDEQQGIGAAPNDQEDSV